MPIDCSTNCRMRAGFGVIPSTHRIAKDDAGVAERLDAPKQPIRDDGLEDIQLQLPRFRRERHRDVAADDVEADLVHDLRDDRIDLSGHDRRPGLHRRAN